MNTVTISGTIITEPEFRYEKLGEKFYGCLIQVPRLSGTFDTLPLVISEQLLSKYGINEGGFYTVTGQFRSHNKIVNGKSKLILTVFAQYFISENPIRYNEISMIGYICKPPVYRTTPLNREITDMLIAVNRAHGKSDYIPCIAWGRNARFVGELGVGTAVAITGRVQSRDYQKDGKTLTAYEVSISSISVEAGNDTESV